MCRKLARASITCLARAMTTQTHYGVTTRHRGWSDFAINADRVATIFVNPRASRRVRICETRAVLCSQVNSQLGL